MPTEARYDAIAEWYAAWAEGGASLFAVEPLHSLMGDVAGRRVLDLACGHGAMARSLAAGGATVTGVDIAARLLAIAQQHEAAAPLGITYVHDDAQTLGTVADAVFDGAACRLALMDIPDLAATFRAVARVLKPGGWFAFSLVHPCFYPPHSDTFTAPDGTTYRRVRRYFDEGEWFSDNPEGVRGKVGAYHRTLSTYLNTMTDAGLRLDCLREPPVTPNAATNAPRHTETPFLLVVRCVKG